MEIEELTCCGGIDLSPAGAEIDEAPPAAQQMRLLAARRVVGQEAEEEDRSRSSISAGGRRGGGEGFVAPSIVLCCSRSITTPHTPCFQASPQRQKRNILSLQEISTPGKQRRIMQVFVVRVGECMHTCNQVKDNYEIFI